ncbi:Inner membrane permease YgbN [Crateriforma conspicua]|uniref:Inner membrane permease YgbN n=1 Tax=Crateriforma conspicua TaxID=2527996 RepID=A0A5C6FYI0_9PLAN|nr:GntP family permease [Crateriforma conspicua]TWU66360.1 Inner membrane permease YgbN [Crateriforma conspicua]
MHVWWLVAIAVVAVLTAILIFRLHAFLTLLLAGWLVGLLTLPAALQDYAANEVAKGKMTSQHADAFVQSSAADRLVHAFGETAGKVGVLIALAGVIGSLLMASGAASVIVDAMLRLTGPKRAPEAMAASSFVLGVPVFFDTVFYLMVPLAQSLRRKVGKDYVLFLLAILAGGSIAHSLVPPTPGPLQVAEIIGVDVGTMLLAGLGIGSVTSVLSLAAARTINRFVEIPLPETATTESQDAEQALGETASGRPSLVLALLPIVVPVVLIATGSTVAYLAQSSSSPTGGWVKFVDNLCDKNVALAIGCALSFLLMRYCDPKEKNKLVATSLAAAGSIILITAAGGAFGAMLRQAGIAGAVAGLAEGVPGLMILPLAFIVTVAIRTLQGSATVAMITAAGVMQGFAADGTLPFHPVYLAMAIGAGSKPVSWMTDSAFWVITRMSGMTEAQGLKVISPMSTAMGLAALLVTVSFAYFLPMAG